MRHGRIALFALILQVGCTVAGPTPEARVRRFSTARPSRIIAVPTSGAAPAVTIRPHLQVAETDMLRFRGAIDAHVRMELELRGLVVVDEESLNGTLRERMERTRRDDDRTQTRVEVSGDSFATSSRAVQDEVMTVLAIDGRLVPRLSFGPLRLASTTERATTVELELRSLRDEVIVRSTCAADAGANADYPAAVDRATRCALHGLVLGLRRAS